MAFSRKIFIAVFLTILVIGTSLIWAAHNYVREQTYENFVSRYTVFSRVLGDTLSRLDVQTETLMYNAAKVVAEHDTHKGLLSTEELKKMRADLNVTHIFVINKKGDFIRSTNEDPRLIPNAFSFCRQYEDMVTGSMSRASTPIIHPQPEPKPYKFMFVPNENRERLLEVGVRVDFIAKTLTDALGSDTSVLSMSLYDPHGTSFGRFRSKEYQWNESKLDLPAKFPAIVDAGSDFKFYTKVASSQPRCCQCDVSKTSVNGEYYYILESTISKKELEAILANTKATFLFFGLGNLILALVFSRLLSRKLVKNIEKAVERVREIKEYGQGRIDLGGKDEVSELTEEFDNLMDSLEESQKRIIEAEKVQSKVQLAKEVAHNIKSPIIAIEMILPHLVSVPERLRKTLQGSVREIKALSERLKNQADSLMPPTSDRALELIYLPIFLHDLVTQKQFEISSNLSMKIDLNKEGIDKDAFTWANSDQLKSIMSNLINNAIESYGFASGEVKVSCCNFEAFNVIKVTDKGAGIPAKFIEKLGTERITFKGNPSRGIGLVHARRTIESWKGYMKIDSVVGQGTSVSVYLPKNTGLQINDENKYSDVFSEGAL